jgi:hypothetical protein
MDEDQNTCNEDDLDGEGASTDDGGGSFTPGPAAPDYTPECFDDGHGPEEQGEGFLPEGAEDVNSIAHVATDATEMAGDMLHAAGGPVESMGPGIAIGALETADSISKGDVGGAIYNGMSTVPMMGALTPFFMPKTVPTGLEPRPDTGMTPFEEAAAGNTCQ